MRGREAMEARRALAAFAVFVLLALSGCGGADQGTTTMASVTKREFVKKANAVCAQDVAKIDAVYSPWAKKPIPGGADREEFMDKVAEEIVVPVRAKEVDRLRAIGLPRGAEREVGEILSAIEEGVRRGRENRHSLRAAGNAYAFHRAFLLEMAFGLERCALG
jgi:hypothetical protein